MRAGYAARIENETRLAAKYRAGLPNDEPRSESINRILAMQAPMVWMGDDQFSAGFM